MKPQQSKRIRALKKQTNKVKSFEQFIGKINRYNSRKDAKKLRKLYPGLTP